MPGIATAIGVSIRQIKMFDLMQVNHGGEITHANRAHPELRPGAEAMDFGPADRTIGDLPTQLVLLLATGPPTSDHNDPRQESGPPPASS